MFKQSYTIETCGVCGKEVEIPDNRISLCPKCNAPICPCNACFPCCWEVKQPKPGDKCIFDKLFILRIFDNLNPKRIYIKWKSSM